MKRVWPIVASLILGVVVGLVINAAWTSGTWASLGVADPKAFLNAKPSDVNQPETAANLVRATSDAVNFLGQLFIRLLRLAAVPIVLFSVIVGVAGLGNPRHLGRVGARTLVLYLATSVLAVTIGLLIARGIRPGAFLPPESRSQLLANSAASLETAISAASQHKSVWQHMLAMVPTNPFDALARADMLQIILFAVLLGGLLTLIPISRARPLLELAETLSDLAGEFVSLVMRAAPVAVFCLVTPVVASTGLGALKALGVYALCVVGGLLVILTCVYSPLVWALGRMSPREFYRGISPALLVAFTTSSSNATLPVSLRCTVDRLKVPPKLAGFVLPIGATVNMDGTALYQGVATIFIAQAMGIDLSLGQQISIVGFATLAAIGSPGIPGGSLIFLITVLQSVGIPPEGLALILGVDRLLDMSRTVVNVAGDAAVAVAVARLDRDVPGDTPSPPAKLIEPHGRG